MVMNTDLGACDVVTRPRVSIVTPCYNGVEYLKPALRSVERLASSLAVEHVVADGGSTDGSVELLRASLWVRGVSRPDEGLYDALNWTLSEARGDYVQWLNADDELVPEFVVNAVRLLDGDPDLEAVVGDTIFVDEYGQEQRRWSYDMSQALDMVQQARGYFFNINSVLFRRDTLIRAGLFDQRSFPIGADRDVELRLILSGLRAVGLPQPAYRFREHPGSLTTGAGGAIRCQLESAQLYDKWSRVRAVPATAQAVFAVRSKELFLGLGLKKLRHLQTASGGLRLLSRHLGYRPHYVPAALAAWVKHRLEGGGVPMLSCAAM